jgi:hypothetical protein
LASFTSAGATHTAPSGDFFAPPKNENEGPPKKRKREPLGKNGNEGPLKKTIFWLAGNDSYLKKNGK